MPVSLHITGHRSTANGTALSASLLCRHGRAMRIPKRHLHRQSGRLSSFCSSRSWKFLCLPCSTKNSWANCCAPVHAKSLTLSPYASPPYTLSDRMSHSVARSCGSMLSFRLRFTQPGDVGNSNEPGATQCMSLPAADMTPHCWLDLSIIKRWCDGSSQGRCTRCTPLQAEAAEDMLKQGITFFPGAVTSEGRRIRRWDVLWAVYNQAFTYFELVQQRDAKMEQLQKTFDAVRAPA